MTQGILDGLLLTPLLSISEASRNSPFDAVVVGAGTAGLTAARTLVESGSRVAVLELGPLTLLTHISSTGLRFDPILASAVQASLQYSPLLPDGTAFGSLIRGVGGRGMFWNGASPRFQESDFDDWPIQLSELEDHYYPWAEEQLGVNLNFGTGGLGQTVLRLLRRSGFPAQFLPFAIDTRPTKDGWLGGTVGNSVAPLLRSGALTAPARSLQLATNSYTTAIILNDAKTAATGVTVQDQITGQTYEIRARSVVLAAGAFESVKLAMLSGIPDTSELLGRMITDHLFCRAYFPVEPGIYLPDMPEACMLFFRPTAERPYQTEVHLPGDNIFNLKGDLYWKPDATRAYAYMVRSFAPVRSRVENYIEARPGGPGSFVVHFSYAGEDLQLRDAMTAGLEDVRQALGAGPSVLTQVMPPGASHHEAGGLAMGTDANLSVTDPYGRFHHVPNVIVADSASWPNIPATNPHLTIGAIARRQATQLSIDLK